MKLRALFVLTLFCIIFLLFIPLSIVKAIHSDSAMALCFILFYMFNPLFSIIVGLIAGLQIRERFLFPFVVPIVFLISSALIFDFGEIAFTYYAFFYFALGVISMCIGALLHNIKSRSL